jgi:acyl-CoA thioesterase I
LFSRGALMAAWRDAGHPYAEFVATDGLHQNDHGYTCVAQSLARALEAGIDQRTLSASR